MGLGEVGDPPATLQRTAVGHPLSAGVLMRTARRLRWRESRTEAVLARVPRTVYMQHVHGRSGV
jgi:hypothetical protein